MNLPEGQKIQGVQFGESKLHLSKNHTYVYSALKKFMHADDLPDKYLAVEAKDVIFQGDMALIKVTDRLILQDGLLTIPLGLRTETQQQQHKRSLELPVANGNTPKSFRAS